MAHVAWNKGGDAELVGIEGEQVRLRSTIPSAPGSRIEGAVRETGTAIRVKVARCRREASRPEAAFVIEGRLLDATRGVRAELGALLGPAAAPKGA